MSICFTVDVFCDGDAGNHVCTEWIFGTVQHYNISGTRKIARKRAKIAGWINKNGKDYCPECAKKMR